MSDRRSAWMFRLLRSFCPERLYEEIEGDLIQRFHTEEKQFGTRRARRRLIWNVFRFFRPGILLRNQFSIDLTPLLMFGNYFKTTYRHIRKSKINFAFKLGGLTLALLSFLTIAIYVSFQLSYDKYHSGYERIYRVNTERRENGKQEKYGVSHVSFGPMISGGFPEIEASARMSISNMSQLSYKQKIVNCGIFPADSSLFSVLGFTFIRGTKDALRKPGSIVLTRTLVQKIFGNDDPLQKFVSFNNGDRQYQVTAVIEDMRPDSHFMVEGFIPIDEGGPEFSINSITSPVDFVDQASILYVKFRQDSKPETFISKFNALLDKRVPRKDREANGFKIFLQPLEDIYFDAPYKYEFTRKGNVIYLSAFIALGIFLLLAAGINYINLSIADFGRRIREIGVRKVMGAKRSQVALQVILETVVYCVCALIVAGLVLYLLFPAIAAIIDPNLRFEMLAQRNVMLLVALTLVVLIVFATGFPAYWMATSKSAADLKAIHAPVHSSSLGKSLLVMQFVISVLCISATLTMNRQIDFIHTKDLGFDRKNILVLTMPENLSVRQAHQLKNEFKAIAGVSDVSNSSFRVGGGYWKDWYTAEIDGEMKPFELYEVFSDDDLFKTLGMKLIDGRTFRSDLPADSGAAFVINETAARELGWKDPIGKRIVTHPEEKGRWDGRVVGLVGDINISSLHQKIQPLVMRLPYQNEYPEQFLYIRIDGAHPQVLEAINKKYAALLPGYPIDLYFVDDFYNSRYQAENRAYTSLRLGTMIILLVSSLGIFSLAAYMSARRMKEFGIRKVLGATVGQIALLHINHFVRIVLISNIIALPVAYWIMNEWLSGFAYKAGLSAWIFAAVALISLALVVLSTGYSSWRSGKMNPVDVIKLQ